MGIRQARVRWHAVGGGVGTKESALARVEVGRDEMPRAFEKRDEIKAAGETLGFAYVTLDLAGYRMGSHNELLRGRALPIVK
jgi:uncharacterized protein